MRPDITKTLTALFYDLAKAVPIGVLNSALLNTVVFDLSTGEAMEFVYSDEDLRKWAEEFALQLLEYKLKFRK